MPMPRKPRLHVPGGLYHVMLRGNNREAIFFDTDDRRRWESLLAEGLQRYGQRIHAYCWMTNHIHMAIQCGTTPVANLIRFVASRYASLSNRKYQRSGHLFERRHRLVLVQADIYLLALIRYIHQNPLRANIVADLRTYPWSSHRAYMRLDKVAWLTRDWVLSMFGATETVARRRYAAFMSDAEGPQFNKLFITGGKDDDRLLGDDGFGKSVARAVGRLPAIRTLDEIISEFCSRYGITEAELAAQSRERPHAKIRTQIALLAIETGAATLAAVARRFGRSESVLSRSLSRLRKNKSIS
jgi:REP element-mobilizing transposase RayT